MIVKLRIITVLVLLMILFPASLVMANGQKEEKTEAGEQIELEFWHFHTEGEGEFMDFLATEYTKRNPNVVVKSKLVPQNDYMGAALTTAFASGKGPDVFFVAPGTMMKYVDSGIAMDLSSYFTPEIRSDFLESSLDAVMVDGKILAIPFEVELVGLYYNKKVLESAGVEPPKTWPEYIEATKVMTTDDQYGTIIETFQGVFQNFLWYPFLWQTGSRIVDPVAKKSVFKGPGVEAALQLWRDLIDAGAARSLTTGGWDATFIGDGSTATQICGTWIIKTLENTYGDTDIGVVPLPVPVDGVPATDAGGWKFMVNSRSNNADEAAKFIMWAMAEDIDLPLKWCTDVKFAYSPRKSVVDAGKAIYSQGLRANFTEYMYDTAISEPRHPAEVITIVGEAIQQAMFTDKSIRKIVEEADKKINVFLKEYEGSL